MRIYELVPEEGRDLVIHNEATGHTLVLTSQGAVYNNEDTADLRNMSIAFGVLITSTTWRAATEEEIQAFRVRPATHMLELQWTIPTRNWRRPQLTVVQGIPTDGTQIGKIE